MNILVISERPFPYGMASTNRLISYSKGLVEANNYVKICCIKPTEIWNVPAKNIDFKGVFNSIEFEYTPGTTIRPENPVRRLYLFLKGFTRSISLLNHVRKTTGLDVVFMGLSNACFTFIYFLYSRMFHIKFVQERSEYPFIRKRNSLFGKLNTLIYLFITCKLFDGFIVISATLANYYQKWLRKNTRVFILHTLVEPERFLKPARTHPVKHPYIAYVGSMYGTKDGVSDLIEAFGKIAGTYSEYKIVLIGDIQFEGFDSLLGIVDRLNLKNKVIFTGRLERDEIPDYLVQAEILTLARPATRQAEGGFPSKIGEYLATGNPVVVTGVGEIPEFLTDGVNAFLAEPGNPDKFADKLAEAISDLSNARKIGDKGKKLASTVFNYKVQSKKLSDFLNSI